MATETVATISEKEVAIPVVEVVAEKPRRREKKGYAKAFDKEAWKPKTEIGKKVKSGEIKNLDEILENGDMILESEIIDCLIPNLELDIIAIGQSKGKFGGGKRNIWRQTQKKTAEGNKPHFTATVIVGNKNGFIGLGRGKAKETMPAREKAIKNAKLNVIRIARGCGSWDCGCGEQHSIPFAVEGKTGSIFIKIMPAPKGSGLIIEKEAKKMLVLAGIKDVYTKSFGQTTTKANFILACFDALKKLNKMKVRPEYYKKSGLVKGALI